MCLTVWKPIALLSSIVILSGCSLLTPAPREVEIRTVELKIPIQHPPMPRPIDMKEPKWYVVSNKNLEEFLERIENESGTMVFMAMSVPDYELMAYNLQEIKRYVKETKEVVVYYRTVTDPDDEKEVEEETQDESSLMQALKERVSGGRGNENE